MNRFREGFYAAIVATLSVPMALALFGRPWEDWKYPYNYLDDGLDCLGIVQMGIERWWATGSDRLGAPAGFDLAYYPMPENGQLFFLNILGRIAPNAGIATNLYLFLTFFLCAGAAFVVLRRFGVHRAPAGVGALVYSLSPYHFWRAETHLFVSGYYWVPLLCWSALTLHGEARHSPWPTRAQCVVAFISPLINTYYSFFFGMLTLTTTVIAWLMQRAWAPLRRGAVMLAVLGAGLCLNLSRSLMLRQSHSLAFDRSPRQAEQFGLKMAQMVLPAFQNVSERAAQAVQDYATTLSMWETASSDLGLVGGCAFIVMLGATFTRPRDRTVADACSCALLCFLYGTIGGLSSIFAFLVSPTIRSPNRIVVFIMFFSILVSLLLAQQASSHFYGRAWFRNVRRACCGAVICLLFWDMSLRPLQTISSTNDSSYRADSIYFPALEASLPPGTQVFNAPHITFPEGGPKTKDYDAFRFFVHTRTMKGSYGSVRFSPQDNANRDAWNKMASGDAQSFITYLREQGFAGVLLNRRILSVDAAQVESRLRASFTPQQNDTGGDFVYFALR